MAPTWLKEMYFVIDFLTVIMIDFLDFLTVIMITVIDFLTSQTTAIPHGCNLPVLSGIKYFLGLVLSISIMHVIFACSICKSPWKFLSSLSPPLALP